MIMSKRTRTIFIVAIPVVIILSVALVIFVALPSSAKGIDLSAKLSELIGVVQVRITVKPDFNPSITDSCFKTAMQLQTANKAGAAGFVHQFHYPAGTNDSFSLDPAINGV
jgi:hypothetical protein